MPLPLPHPFCGCVKIGSGASVLAVVELTIAFFTMFIYLPLIFTRAKCEKFGDCVGDTLILFSILIGCIFNFVLQAILLFGGLLVVGVKNVKLCRVWLRLRVITLGIIYSSLYYLVRGVKDGPTVQAWIIILATLIFLHSYTWYVVLALTRQLRDRDHRRQMERLPPPLNVGAPRPNQVNPQPKPVTTPSRLDKITSGADNNNNIV